MANKGKTIWVTEGEYKLIDESKQLFQHVTKVKMSWGAFLTALSLGALAAKSLAGLESECPHCGYHVEMILRKPRLHRERPKAS